MSNSTPLYFQDVLDSKRRALLPFLQTFTRQGYILGGGTALALLFGHRESIDFDFFLDRDLKLDTLFEQCLSVFDKHQVLKIFDAKNTLYLTVDGVKISFFSYHYETIAPVIPSEYLTLYSLEDIAAMKLRAIQNRATLKDYVDLYYIIDRLGLASTLATFAKKFGPIVTESYLLKSLIYFDDLSVEPLVLHDEDMNFARIQQGLQQKVMEYLAQ